MNLIELLNLEGVTFFKKDNKNYAYISRKIKRKNEKLRDFHNLIKIEKKEIIIIHSSEERKKILDYFTNFLGYKKD